MNVSVTQYHNAKWQRKDNADDNTTATAAAAALVAVKSNPPSPQ